MKVLLFGPHGQVGSSLAPLLAPLGELVSVARGACDLANADAVRDIVRSVRPDVIVNAAAYTAVDKAESEPELAHAVNVDAPRAMAEAATELGARLIHYSTDYVFDGEKATPYVESDAVAPTGTYGRSKEAGEAAVRAACAQATILRTAWVFGPIGNNFVKTILRLASTRDSLRVVHDQVGNPTSAELIAATTALALARFGRELPGGTYHLAGSESASWNDFARVIVETARAHPSLGVSLDPACVERITTADYPTPARRPANSRLDCSRLEQDFGVTLPGYRAYLERMLALRTA